MKKAEDSRRRFLLGSFTCNRHDYYLKRRALIIYQNSHKFNLIYLFFFMYY